MTATATLKRSWAFDLDTKALYELLKLRFEVFVLEQKTGYHDLDDYDLVTETRHLWLQDGSDGRGVDSVVDGEVIAYLRLMEEYDDGVKSFRIARVCTAKPQRGRGHTTRLLQAALAEVGSAAVRISAPNYLVEMYAKHGFKPEGEEFDDAGVPSVPMRRGGGAPWTASF